MTLRDEEGYKSSFWDWQILDGCFGKGMSPTDIEGFIERRGNFLIIETKRPHESLSRGQERAFRRFARQGYSVIVVWGEKNKPMRGKVLFRNKETNYDSMDINRFRKLVHSWYVWADRKPFEVV